MLHTEGPSLSASQFQSELSPPDDFFHASHSASPLIGGDGEPRHVFNGEASPDSGASSMRFSGRPRREAPGDGDDSGALMGESAGKQRCAKWRKQLPFTATGVGESAPCE